MSLKTVVVLALIAVSGSVTLDKDKDRIVKLPGLQTQPNYKMYSGYLSASNGKWLHYWFLESQRNPKSDPVVLWLNGGPGCSSMMGLLEENGPFWTTPEGPLKTNNYSWNKIANMLYVESPAGVGFSYSDDQNYTLSDDVKTAADNLEALKDFFRKFPEYQNSDFYITGESYGGVYVPTLAEKVMDEPTINFKGFSIGNGLLDNGLQFTAQTYVAYYHGLIGNVMWRRLLESCCPHQVVATRCDFYGGVKNNASCKALMAQVEAITWSIGINPYNVYAECAGGVPDLTNSIYQVKKIHKKRVVAHPGPYMYSTKYNSEGMTKFQTEATNDEIVLASPCSDSSASTNYLNQKEVRDALHISSRAPYWLSCSTTVSATYKKQYWDVREQFLKILNKGYRLNVYYGDGDLACNFLGAEWFIDMLKQPVVEEYKAWYVIDDKGRQQVAGFVKQFKNLTFLTIKGSGHFVPRDRPQASFDAFYKFLNNEKF